jgi:peptidyl-prolyl cis-trans isomerase B (cyclophilin B)
VDVAKTPAAKEDKEKTKVPTLTSAEGLSAGQKIFLIAAIVAVCAVFLRSRGSKSTGSAGGFKDKSLA